MLSFCVALLIYMHIVYESPPPDKELAQTPSGPNRQQKGIFDIAVTAPPRYLSDIYENNIFLVNRGHEEKTAETVTARPYKGVFELTGLCKIGNIEGAVLTSSATRGTKAIKSKFFRINDAIGNSGFKLVSVTMKENTAVISNGRIREVLKLDQNDTGSLKRRQTAVKKQQAVKKLSITTPAVKRGPTLPPKKPAAKPPAKSRRPMTEQEKMALRKKIIEKIKKAQKAKAAPHK